MVRVEQQKCLDREDILKLYTKGYTRAEDLAHKIYQLHQR